MHETSLGYFAYPRPFLRLNLAQFDEFARKVFLWGYQPRPGDVIVDVGAGVGEETLTFSRAVSEQGRVISIEAHPKTFRCLQKLVQYNRLGNVMPLHKAITEPSRQMTVIDDSVDYLRNHINADSGTPVPATTLDALCREHAMSRIHFLKMNIEGAERLAIRGIHETLERTEVLCVSCHDFLAERSGDESLRTKGIVLQFLQGSAFHVLERPDSGLPPYVRDQVWAYNPKLKAGGR
jgi:FkbM family methyltransferase